MLSILSSTLAVAYTVPTASVECTRSGTDLEPTTGFKSLLSVDIAVTCCKYNQCTVCHWVEGTQDMVEVQCAGDEACALGTYNGNDNIWSSGMQKMEQTIINSRGEVFSFLDTVGSSAHEGAAAHFAEGTCAVRSEVGRHEEGNIYVTVALWGDFVSRSRHGSRERIQINLPAITTVAPTTVSTATTAAPEVSTTPVVETTEGPITASSCAANEVFCPGHKCCAEVMVEPSCSATGECPVDIMDTIECDCGCVLSDETFVSSGWFGHDEGNACACWDTGLECADSGRIVADCAGSLGDVCTEPCHHGDVCVTRGDMSSGWCSVDNICLASRQKHETGNFLMIIAGILFWAVVVTTLWLSSIVLIRLYKAKKRKNEETRRQEERSRESTANVVQEKRLGNAAEENNRQAAQQV